MPLLRVRPEKVAEDHKVGVLTRCKKLLAIANALEAEVSELIRR
jgi:hypothetical protein